MSLYRSLPHCSIGLLCSFPLMSFNPFTIGYILLSTLNLPHWLTGICTQPIVYVINKRQGNRCAKPPLKLAAFRLARYPTNRIHTLQHGLTGHHFHEYDRYDMLSLPDRPLAHRLYAFSMMPTAFANYTPLSGNIRIVGTYNSTLAIY